ncbi:ComEC family competence protein [Tautonia plasticadhaerens]|uniref:ComEC family competence protein n=2 Tax=Tautonia plasticadhaerens TaxID=2527974 RepID=A0A518H5J3_9BACT|nr:ComEC family competence protein [Tautonia plasticadhaerens]
MVPVAIAMAAGILADRRVEPCGTATWAILALACSAVALATLRRPRVVYPALLLAIAAFGGGRHHARWSDLAPDDLSRVVSTEARLGWVRGFLRTVPEYREAGVADRPGDEGYTRFELQLTAASDGRSWHPASGRAVVSAGGDRTDLEMGDPVEAAGSIALLAGPLNPGERDPRDFHRSRGVRLRLSVDDPAGLGLDPEGRPRPLLRWLGKARTWGDRRLSDLLGDRTAPVASALLIGDRGGIDGETTDAFSRTGAAHLLAISGLHLSAVAGGLGLLSILLGLGLKGAARLVLAATIGYATLVGWSPSVGRSATMVAAVCLATILDRQARASNTIALAAAITMAINPAVLFSVGWQLSFLAVGVLALGVPTMVRRVEGRFFGPDPEGDPLDELERRLEPRWRRAVRRAAFYPVAALAASAAVSLATAPLVAWRFNVVAPIGILLNLPLIPVAGVAVGSGGLALMLSAVWAPLATPAAWACDASLGLAMGVVHRAEAVPMGHAFVPTPTTGWVVAFYASLAMAGRASAARWPVPARRTAWLGVGLVGAFGSIATLAPHRPETTEVEVLAVGHGLSVVIQGPDGSAALYDCGRSGDPGVGRRIAAPALWGRGVRRLETLVISHADADHYNGVPDLLERFEVGRLVVPEGFEGDGDDSAVLAVLDDARARGVPVVEARAGDRIGLVPGLTAGALHPPPGWLPDAPDNDRSLVLDLPAGGRHLLLTGDLEGAGLAELVAGPSFPIDAMLAPHHGGRSSNPGWLYDWASPGLVVSSQRAPRAGATDPLASLDERGIPVLRTAEGGAVLLRSLGPREAEPGGGPGWSVGGRPGPSDPKPGNRFIAASLGVRPPPGAARLLAAVGGLALGVWLCLALAVVHFGAWSLVLPGRANPSDEPFPGPWRSASITSADGLTLRGWRLDARGGGPDTPDRFALVLHGMAEASPSMRGRAEALHRLGWSVLVPDLRSFGRSDGDRCTFGAREAGDLRSWVDALLVDHPGAAVVAWGRSMGAAVALRAATEDDRIRAIVLEAPYADLRRALASRLSRLPIPGAGLLAGLVLSRAARIAGVPLDRPRPVDLAPRASVPALILQGGKDRIAPIVEARRLADAFPDDRRPEVETVADAGHADVFDLGGPSLASRIGEFLGRAASPRPGSDRAGEGRSRPLRVEPGSPE